MWGETYMTAQGLWSRLWQGLPNTLLMTAGMAVAGLGSGLILARSLGPAGRGELATIILWPTMLAGFGDLGLGFAFNYFAGKDRDSIPVLWSLAWLVSAVIGGTVGLGGALILPLQLSLSEVALLGLRWNLAITPIIILTGYLNFLLLGTGHLVEYNLVRICSSVCYLLGVVVVAVFGIPSIIAYTSVYILAQLASALLVIAFNVWCLNLAWGWEPQLIKLVMSYGAKVYASNLMAQANLRLDQLIMTVIASPTQLGLYVVAVAISGMVYPLYVAVAIVVLSRVTQAPSILLAGRVAIRHLWLVLLVASPLTVVLSVAMPLLLPLLFGDGYGMSILPAQILVVAAFFQGCGLVLSHSLRGMNHPGKTAISEGVGLLMSIVFLFVLLPIWGILGAAGASLAAYSVVALTQLFLLLNASGLTWIDLRPSKKMLPQITIFRTK